MKVKRKTLIPSCWLLRFWHELINKVCLIYQFLSLPLAQHLKLRFFCAIFHRAKNFLFHFFLLSRRQFFDVLWLPINVKSSFPTASVLVKYLHRIFNDKQTKLNLRTFNAFVFLVMKFIFVPRNLATRERRKNFFAVLT